MTENEKTSLAALSELLDMIDQSDYPLVHSTVRKGVASGEYSKEFEAAYSALVEFKLEQG